MVYCKVVPIPPSILPIKRIWTLSDKTENKDMATMMQYPKQAARRPYLSAREPTKRADTAPARKPVVNNAATTSSGRPF